MASGRPKTTSVTPSSTLPLTATAAWTGRTLGCAEESNGRRRGGEDRKATGFVRRFHQPQHPRQRSEGTAAAGQAREERRLLPHGLHEQRHRRSETLTPRLEIAVVVLPRRDHRPPRGLVDPSDKYGCGSHLSRRVRKANCHGPGGAAADAKPDSAASRVGSPAEAELGRGRGVGATPLAPRGRGQRRGRARRRRWAGRRRAAGAAGDARVWRRRRRAGRFRRGRLRGRRRWRGRRVRRRGVRRRCRAGRLRRGRSRWVWRWRRRGAVALGDAARRRRAGRRRRARRWRRRRHQHHGPRRPASLRRRVRHERATLRAWRSAVNGPDHVHCSARRKLRIHPIERRQRSADHHLQNAAGHRPRHGRRRLVPVDGRVGVALRVCAV